MKQLFQVDYTAEFLQNILDGKQNYTLISKPAPIQDENEPFKEVVASTFNHYVIDNNNDTLLVITAPWCGHCKVFKPILRETANNLTGLPYNFYWFDGTMNEVSFLPKFKGFPTLYLYPSGKKDSPIEFDGERTMEGVKQFIQQYASIKLYPETNSTETNSTI